MAQTTYILLNFAVCLAPDPNEGRRQAAREENKKRHQKFYSDSIKQWNKETDFKDNFSKILGLGASRSRSDFQTFVLDKQGEGLLQKENLAKQMFSKSFVDEGGRSNRAGKSSRAKWLQGVAKVDRQMYQMSTKGEAMFETGLDRRTQAMLAQNKKALGFGPQFGPPTMLPPKDRAGQFMNSLSMGMNIASGVMSFFPGSDVRLKDNIKKIGTSVKGYGIYKFRYHDSTKEYIGVMAQEILAKKPEAVVKLNTGYYGINYDLLDVEFREVA
tara:strand:- start:713 stop:1525 length:813 start_codon:yes stop_codon:yes gene_type:complete